MIDPEKYESNKSVAARDAAELVPKLVDLMGEWTPNEKILDYGCGAGSTGYKFILPHVLKSDSTLYSVDVSEKMVEFAKANYSHPKIKYAIGNILSGFPFTDVQFDKIFSILVFNFFKDMSIAFKKILDIMKPGGRLGFTCMHKSSYISAMKELGESEKWKKYLQGYEEYLPLWMDIKDGDDHQTCQQILHKAGFNIIHLEILKRSFHMECIVTMLELYMSLNPLWPSLPAELLPEFMEDLRTFVTKDAGIPRSSREITMDYECIFAVVEKPKTT